METIQEMYAREEADLRDELVTHLMQVDGRVVVVEDVPARVNQVTGERLFSLETADWLYQLAQGTAPTARARVE
ncbi:hypothetical protein [uncultured Hymenobacter sp.]|uniref:hypothetical protein n=1 Tax=uncultured Hymenobacter sp. TaxID=170016 RepID=UPI0035CCA93D